MGFQSYFQSGIISSGTCNNILKEILSSTKLLLKWKFAMWVSEQFLIISSAGSINAVYNLLDWKWSDVPNKSLESLESLLLEIRAWAKRAGWCTRCMLGFSPLTWDWQLIIQIIWYVNFGDSEKQIATISELNFKSMNPQMILNSFKENFSFVKVTGVCHMV